MCRAPVKSSPPTNQHPTFYRPDAPPPCRPNNSVKALKGKQCQSSESTNRMSINQSIIYCSKCIVKRTNVNVTQHNVSRTERLKALTAALKKNENKFKKKMI